MKKYISYVYVILSAVCWGFIGFFNRMLTCPSSCAPALSAS